MVLRTIDDVSDCKESVQVYWDKSLYQTVYVLLFVLPSEEDGPDAIFTVLTYTQNEYFVCPVRMQLLQELLIHFRQ